MPEAQSAEPIRPGRINGYDHRSSSVTIDMGCALLELSMWADDVVRVRYAIDAFTPRRSWAVVPEQSPWTCPDTTIALVGDGLRFSGGFLDVRVASHGRLTVSDRRTGRTVIATGDD